jgi:hypothetical protein
LTRSCGRWGGERRGRACIHRRSVARNPQMDGAGVSAREIVDYLGDERVPMAQDVYMSPDVAEGADMVALERLARAENC